jgi:prophage maintenance system killer protein
MEAEEKQFEKRMQLIMGINCVLAVAIMFLLLNGSGLTVTDTLKKIIIVILVLVMMTISNALSTVAIVLRKNK